MAPVGRAVGRPVRLALLRLLLVLALALAGTLVAGAHGAHAATTSTSQFKGVNWADQRDNFVNGVLYPSGLSSSDTYSSAETVAGRVVGQLYGITGANTVRMPINESTVSTNWSAYTGAIDGALSKGNVILAYWAYSNGEPASTSAFNSMWDTVVAKYGSNPNAYFEVINEPYGYSTTDLDNLYNGWLTRYSGVPRGHVILDGAGYATNVAAVGSDSRLANTLLAVHYYSFFVSSPYNDENEWATGIAGLIGSYAGRTIATEWGAPMSPGSKNNVSYNTIDYSIPSGSYFADYVRGVSTELRTLGVGSVYWPGLRDGDWYSLTSRTGSGSSLALSLVNGSGLTRLQYAWGVGNGGGTYVRIKNSATGLYVDNVGSTSSGSAVDQYSSSTSSNQQWVIQNDGNYVRIMNRASGLYLDGLGSTGNGAAVEQYSDTNSTNQQWTVVSNGNTVYVKNRATGMYLDGMGRTSSGSGLAQYSSSGSANQQWTITAAGS
ncbi:RICIN domain-containing protein [Peterkaempfera sp. SMS 1(5)a]|uniref:RICIN domain-containing protein n=1 Tax=Peterkaempfera podocarpi TaxID=3232308 RepID=UPI003670CF17